MLYVAWGPNGRAALFQRPLFTSGPETPDDFIFWGHLIAYYAGLRLEEAAQLRPDDVATKEGLDVIQVREGPGQRVKCATSIREVPIHPELKRLGLVRLAARARHLGHEWLFPNLDKGTDGTFSSILTKVLRDWRIREGLYMPKRVFHSLRSDFYNEMKFSGVEYNARQVLLGHAINDVSENHYGKREYPIERLADFISEITSESSHICPPI
jgi:integrase